MSRLISIIIPTHNRAHLIAETMESIMNQSHRQWECIVVDDNSKDYTEELLSFYCELDSRIKFYKRPNDRKKGANTCRNFGYEQSVGDYVIFFDSDDLMLPQKLEVQLSSLTGTTYNFSVDKFRNLQDRVIFEEEAFKRNITNDLNGVNYAMSKVYWGTINVLMSKDLLNSYGVQFNENLKSGQEYNFFTKLFFKSKVHTVYVDRVQCTRRIHTSSIQARQNSSQITYLENKFELFIKTYDELYEFSGQNIRLYLIMNCQSFAFRLFQKNQEIPELSRLIIILFKETGFFKTFVFLLSLLSLKITGKGYKLIKLSYPSAIK
ncbi:glycosyltransferase family 2 protein [Salegentibacter mishustinae]|uniref:glycosyltransferase family 2 protein n=1 Tax=Salegentibacter mishustinae TaxID=270918 RepID=UPI00248F8C85|nr:glycosyltransferase family 2 protein [Salegentibacter mishustinae]